MAGALSNSRLLIEAFNWQLNIDAFSFASFSKVSQLATTTTVTEYREAGSLLPVKDPSEIAFSNFTLEGGASNDLTFYNWNNNIAQNVMGFGTGLPVALDKRNATLYCFGRDKSIIKKVQIYGAFPVEFIAGDWDNDQDRVLIEKLTLAFDYFVIS